MKKFGMIIGILCISLLVGCSSTGKYKEGVYHKEVPDNYGGQENTAIAEVTVDSKGKISKVVLDTTYTTNDGKTTTKKNLGDSYGMKGTSSAIGTIKGGAEWYEQVESLEKAVISHQGIDFITLDSEGKTDAVSGCTIKISALYTALEKALAEAIK